MLRRTVVSDFTPESLLLTHNSNPRSVVILVDEIMGMFNSANRYTNGQLIEQQGTCCLLVRSSGPICSSTSGGEGKVGVFPGKAVKGPMGPSSPMDAWV